MTLNFKSDISGDYVQLNQIKIPLADLRVQINELMKEGIKEIPLGDLLHIIKTVKDDSQG
jgi:hypothetical protein